MICPKFLICTECQKNKNMKPRQFKSIKNLNIHLTRKHKTKYKVGVKKSTLYVSRLKNTKLKNNLGI